MDRRTLAVVSVAVALGGCGGGGGGGGTSAADYREAATRICNDANRRADALDRPKSLAALRAYLDKTLAIVESDTTRLQALHPPDELKAGHAAAIKAQQAAVERLRTLLDRLKSSKPSVAELQAALTEVQRLSDRADRQFRALGLKACAQ